MPLISVIIFSTRLTVSFIALVLGPLTVTSTELLPAPVPKSWFFHSPGCLNVSICLSTLSGSSSKLGVSDWYLIIIAMLLVLPVGSCGVGPPIEYWTVSTLSFLSK